MLRQLQVLCLTLLFVLAGTTACQPEETELSFETIERADKAGYGDLEIDPLVETRLVLVASQKEIAQLEDLVSPAALEQLTRLDFEHYFAIALFRGNQASSGYDTLIERVARQGDKIVVYARLWEPSPYWEVQMEVTAPYHLVKVQKGDGVSRNTELVLQSQLVTPTPPSR